MTTKMIMMLKACLYYNFLGFTIISKTTTICQKFFKFFIEWWEAV